jgi:hypothetical protein
MMYIVQALKIYADKLAGALYSSSFNPQNSRGAFCVLEVKNVVFFKKSLKILFFSFFIQVAVGSCRIHYYEFVVKISDIFIMWIKRL